MSAEKQPAGIVNAAELNQVFKDIETASHLIDFPEYFFQKPTPKQEEKFKEEYSKLWQRVEEQRKIVVPETIPTFFGKVEFIRDITYFEDLTKKHCSGNSKLGRIFFSRKESSLSMDRKKTCSNFSLLSPEDVKKLQAKNTNSPLQRFDFSTNKLTPVAL